MIHHFVFFAYCFFSENACLLKRRSIFPFYEQSFPFSKNLGKFSVTKEKYIDNPETGIFDDLFLHYPTTPIPSYPCSV